MYRDGVIYLELYWVIMGFEIKKFFLIKIIMDSHPIILNRHLYILNTP